MFALVISLYRCYVLEIFMIEQVIVSGRLV